MSQLTYSEQSLYKGNSIECVVSLKVVESHGKQNLMQILLVLNEIYNIVRINMLMIYLLPTMIFSYSVLIQEEIPYDLVGALVDGIANKSMVVRK